MQIKSSLENKWIMNQYKNYRKRENPEKYSEEEQYPTRYCRFDFKKGRNRAGLLKNWWNVFYFDFLKKLH